MSAQVAGSHTPVLLEAVLAGLNIQPDGLYVDATFGRGGHSQAILEKLSAQGRLLAFDKDPEAVAAGQELAQRDKRFSIIHGSYCLLENTLSMNAMQGVNGILLDLGVSSPQLDQASRGFSFSVDGPLDMRMDNSQSLSAAEWLQQVDEVTLANVIYEYGEERFSRRIARAIVAARTLQPIQTTMALAELVASAIPRWEKHKHPATRTFQAIRIFINHELDELKAFTATVLNSLLVGGRLVVISFHSLEDRIIKQFIQRQWRGEQELLPKLPVQQSAFHARLKPVGKARHASAAEMENNPRSRSAVLRVAERVS